MWVFLFVCSRSKMCLTVLVMHFHSLNDPVPWGLRLCEYMKDSDLVQTQQIWPPKHNGNKSSALRNTMLWLGPRCDTCCRVYMSASVCVRFPLVTYCIFNFNSWQPGIHFSMNLWWLGRAARPSLYQSSHRFPLANEASGLGVSGVHTGNIWCLCK